MTRVKSLGKRPAYPRSAHLRFKGNGVTSRPRVGVLVGWYRGMMRVRLYREDAPQLQCRQTVHLDPTLVAGYVACRVCGCTDLDCRKCIERTGQPCRWVGPDLCSACVDGGPQ